MTREPALPAWARELRLRYVSGEASIFLLHGNVRDLYPWEEQGGVVTYVSLKTFLERFLGRAKDVVASFNVSEGITTPDPAADRRLRAALGDRRSVGALPTTAAGALELFEPLIFDPSQKLALIIDYVEMIAPNGELSFMGESDKDNLVTLLRWTHNPKLLESDNIIILVTENMADVQKRLVASAQLAPIPLSLPDEAERAAYIARSDRRDVSLELDDGALAKVTAGLSLVQIRALFRRARQSAEAITFKVVSARKKAIIEQECHGLVEFVAPEHDFSHVGGMDRLKADLLRVAQAIKSGQTHRVPMGIIFVGPMGTGKTFLAESFAAESGLTCLKFKNFREKWVGSTEGNLEKILQVVEGLGYVLLILDEADRSMGSATDGDGGTSSRVIARLKEFMSDTSHRGRVVILMMTNRPDKLDVDLKRPGRFDLKIPFFFPETAAERASMMAAVLRKARVTLEAGATLEAAAAATEGYSAAELEAVMLAAVSRAAEADRKALAQKDVDDAVFDVIPSRDTRMLMFMEMLAVFESSSRRMLPERFASMSTEEVQANLDLLRGALGGRV